MPAILPSIKIDSDVMLARCFMPHQVHWIQAEDAIRALVSLGYSSGDAERAVRAAMEASPHGAREGTAELIRGALAKIRG